MTSVFYALAFKPLSLPDAGNLVAVSSVDERGSSRITPLPTTQQLRDAGLGTGHWCAYNSIIEAAESGGRVLESYGDLFSGDCLEVIGLTPALGRWFTSEEAPLTGNGAPVIVISDRFWQRMFDRAPDVLGRTVRIRDTSATVVGVLPPEYRGFSSDLSTDFAIPFNAHRPASGGYMFIGRLHPGGTIEQLRAQVRALWPSVLEAVLPAGPARAQSLAQWSGGAELIPGGFSVLRRLYAAPVRRLALLTVALLAIVCINVGGLMVSRIMSRFSEISAMRALGASTPRIIYPLAAECAILAGAGTLLGVPLAFAASAAFRLLLPVGNMPWTTTTTPQPVVLGGVAIGLVAITGVIAALPIWLASRRSPQLRNDRGTSRGSSGWAQAMLVLQISLTVALVFTSGLIVRSFHALRSVDRGFAVDHLLSLRLSANPAGYKDMDALTYYHSLVQRVSDMPGVRSAGMGRYFGTINAQMTESPIGFAESTDNPATGANDFVSPGFFSTLGVPILSGRDLEWTDAASSERVALVSESLARMLAPDANVVGRVIRFGTTPAYARLRIVGVVGNISIGNVRKTKERMLYLSSIQTGETMYASLHIRTDGPPMQLAQAATAVVAAMGREHVMGAYPEMLFGNSMIAESMGTAVSSIVAVLALIISSVGVFALLRHSVERRTREIGIRMAIGASQRAVSRLIVGQAMRLVAFGLVIGIPVSFAATSVVRSLLFEVTETDPPTLVASIALLLASAVLAAIVPTRKAMRVDPAVALRTE